MDELLRPAGVIRTHKREAETDFFLREPTATAGQSNPASKSDARQRKALTTPEEALEILKNEPDYNLLISVLTFLSQQKKPSFPSIKSPTPLNAQLIQVLVSEIVPNYWALLIEDIDQAQTIKKSGLNLLLFCLSSITGVNAILARLRALIQETKGSNHPAQLKRPDISLNLGILLDVLSRVLQPDNWLSEAYRVAVSGEEAPAKVRPRVQEIVSTIGGGRIVSLAAEAEDVLKNDPAVRRTDALWPAESKQFTQWLGRNVVSLLRSDLGADEKKFASDVFGKALRLGHYGKIPPGFGVPTGLTCNRCDNSTACIRACFQPSCRSSNPWVTRRQFTTNRATESPFLRRSATVFGAP